jgi:maltose-binding protein MalE
MKVFFKIFPIVILFIFNAKAQNLNLVGINPNYAQTGNIIGNFGYNINVASISSFSETVNNKEFSGGQLHFVAQLLLVQKLNKHFAALIRNQKLEMRNLNLAQINVFVNLNWEQVQNWWYL